MNQSINQYNQPITRKYAYIEMISNHMRRRRYRQHRPMQHIKSFLLLTIRIHRWWQSWSILPTRRLRCIDADRQISNCDDLVPMSIFESFYFWQANIVWFFLPSNTCLITFIYFDCYYKSNTSTISYFVYQLQQHQLSPKENKIGFKNKYFQNWLVFFFRTL